jgi:competence protein ComEC
MLPKMPETGWLAALLTVAGAALCVRRLRWLGGGLLSCTWVLWCYDARLDDRLDPNLAGTAAEVVGVVASMPIQRHDYLQFRFRPTIAPGGKGQTAARTLPRTLRVRWYEDYPDMHVGETWRLELFLKPPWGPVNFQGADRERWLFAQGIGALATTRNGKRLRGQSAAGLLIETARESIARELDQRVPDGRARGIVRALAIADRSAMAAGDNELMRQTGTSHLLAISGLHIGLAAAGGLWLGRVLAWLLVFPSRGRRGLVLSAAFGLAAAISYALLAGLAVSTLRAVLMLGAVLLASVFGRSPHPAHPWLLGLAGVLLLDPFAPLGAGFWFSFAAVACLMLIFVPRPDPLPWWKTMLLAQAGIAVLLTPVSAAWFQSFSPLGLIANLIAIPWVSFLVVPLVLAGIALAPIASALSGGLWVLAGKLVIALMTVLQWLARFQGDLPLLPPPGATITAAALAGAVLLVLPRGLPLRWPGVLLLVPLFLPGANRVPEGLFEVEILDVGQGTSVIVRTAQHRLLYDSGPGDGRSANLVAPVIAPALAARGGPPARVIISHGDLDHAGGLASLALRYVEADFLVNRRQPQPGAAPCVRPQSWRWDGVSFAVLHPGPWLPYLGNDSSCVVSIRAGPRSMLLPGDISTAVERRLERLDIGQHEVLLVPHHASTSSSGPSFIERLSPKLAIATAGLGNRFGFPRPEIRNRYERGGTSFWSTGACGAIRLRTGPDGEWLAESARRERRRIWRWPAGANCP